MKRHAAQIVFVEAAAGGKWTGRLLNADAIDIETNTRAKMGCAITEGNTRRARLGFPSSTGFTLITQGHAKGGRRYRRFTDLNDAQKAAIKWAGRRFKVII